MKQIPWPKIHKLEEIKHLDSPVSVPLIEDYTLDDMWYLDTEEARPIFQSQADIVVKRKSKGIIDVGCRTGSILNLLHNMGYTDFNYMGFDTSIEPINFSANYWKDYNNIEFRNESIHNINFLSVNFNVDMVIWSGVLLYWPDIHFDLFKKITIDFYKSNYAIIQEPLPPKQQKYWDERLDLNTIELDKYCEHFKVKKEIVNCEIFSGNRVILDICI